MYACDMHTLDRQIHDNYVTEWSSLPQHGVCSVVTILTSISTSYVLYPSGIFLGKISRGQNRNFLQFGGGGLAVYPSLDGTVNKFKVFYT